MIHPPRFTESEISVESRLLFEKESQPWEIFSAKFKRVAIRLFRIAFGLALLFGAMYCGESALNSLNKPFASHTFLGLIGGIFISFIALLLFTSAWSAAFGKGPTRQEEKEALRNRALESLSIKRPAGMSLNDGSQGMGSRD